MAIRIDADEVVRKVAAGAALLDVLPASVYEKEHLPGARSVPLETFRPENVKDLQRDDVIVVYCYDQH